MRKIATLLAALVLLSGQSPTTSVMHHLVYQFGYNTPVASSGNGTGTTTIDIARAADGGLLLSGTDRWWNTVRARATNTCELYKNGDVKCNQAPNAISPMQVTIFPMLAHSYFHGLNAAATSSWSHEYQLYAAIIPGASGFAGQATTWNCNYNLHGEGPIKGAGSLVLVVGSGTLGQQGGTYRKATSKVRVVYDPVAKVPGIIRDVRTHIPYRSVNSNDLIELKLVQDSGAQHG